MKTKEIPKCACFIALFILSAKLILPLGILPFTLQSAVMIIAGMLLTPRQIVYSYGIYLLLGLIGLPVFANGGGIAYIVQPSFGFLLSFPIAACCCALLRKHLTLHSFVQFYLVALFALLLVYGIGCLYMYELFKWYMGSPKTLGTLMSMGVTPFILSDAISAALGCSCVLRLQSISFMGAKHS